MAHVTLDEARRHEVPPHRRGLPLHGVTGGFNSLNLTLRVSSTGVVLHAEAEGDAEVMKFWPQARGYIEQWRFQPFERDGHAVAAEVQEFVGLVPEERLPKVHVAPPPVRAASKVSITLERSGCFGVCPAYSVELTTAGKTTFEGNMYVVAQGHHTADADADEVRALAKRFVAADFYSLDPAYVAGVTDNPTFALTLTVDGVTKHVKDYVGSWVGMPQVVEDLEEAVDELAGSSRWVRGTDELVPALAAEGFAFRTGAAQHMVKLAAERGQAETVRAMLAAGVPLAPRLPQPVRQNDWDRTPDPDWLTAASNHRDCLQVLIAAKASDQDQQDKDVALSDAAATGDVEAVRMLTAYGANPAADLSRYSRPMMVEGKLQGVPITGSALISAAYSGNPAMLQEILKAKPPLETRDQYGTTAIFAAMQSGNWDSGEAKVLSVRALAEAGANVNAVDKNGNTPLHEASRGDVAAELLARGANVNVRNHDGETPLFTVRDTNLFLLLLEHGADLTIRNNKGLTAMEATLAQEGQERAAALRAAIADMQAKTK